MPHKLHYFPIRGRAQSIRYIMEDNGIPYEDVSLNRESWMELKPKTTFGQVPMIVFEDGTEMVQSNAIMRALARKHGLYGSSDEEANMIDMINDGQEDDRQKYVRMIYTDYEEGKANFVEQLRTVLPRYEKLLEKNGQTFFVGSKISFVDYSMFDLLDNFLLLAPLCLETQPLLKAFHANMAARPSIAKYRDTEAFKSRNVNGNGKQ